MNHKLAEYCNFLGCSGPVRECEASATRVSFMKLGRAVCHVIKSVE